MPHDAKNVRPFAGRWIGASARNWELFTLEES